MKKTLLIAILGAAGLLGNAGPVFAQVAGSTTTVGVAAGEVTEVAKGWSARKGIIGKTVYNDAGEKIGKVDDIIITPEKYVSYLIIGAGGFLGMGKHDVAIPIAQIREQGSRILLPGGTKAALKAMPAFVYATDTTRRDQFVARAEQDIARTKEKIAEVEKKAGAAAGEAKVKMDREMVTVRQDMKAAEEKLAELKRAGEKKWREFESDVSKAIARVRLSIEKAAA